MPNLSEEELRKDFAIAMLFRGELTGGKAGFLRRHPGKAGYFNADAELLFQGYKAAREGDHAQLARFAPTRPLVPGMLRQLNETLESANLPPVTERQVRVILRVIGGLPASQST